MVGIIRTVPIAVTAVIGVVSSGSIATTHPASATLKLTDPGIEFANFVCACVVAGSKSNLAVEAISFGS